MSETKAEDMSVGQLLDKLEKYCDEHDLDCEETEGEANERCTACLAREAKRKYHAG